MWWIVLRLKTLFLDIPLKRKFISVYILLLAVPMMITSLLFYSYSAKSVQNQTAEVIAMSMKQTVQYLDYVLQEIEGLGAIFYNNAALQSALSEKNDTEYDDLLEYSNILSVLNQITENKKVFNITLYVPDSKFYSSERNTIFPFSEIMNDPALSEIMDDKQQRGWSGVREEADRLGQKTRVFSYGIFFVDLDQISNVIAAMRIDIQEESLLEVIGSLGMENKGAWYLLDRKGQIVTNSGDNDINPQDIVGFDEGSEIATIRTVNKNFSVIQQPIQSTGWQLVYSIPTDLLSGDTRRIGVFTSVVFLILLILSALAAAIISGRITSKITLLSQRMKIIQEEIYDEKDIVNEHAKDEVGVLQENYEIMLKKLRMLIQDNYQAKLDKKEARLKLLQAQINPHFLYNVLDQINWMSVRVKAPEISAMAAKLGRFYRIGLSNGKDVITLGEELEHVRIYMDIQKYRLGDAVQFSFCVEEGIENYKIIKMILQPLVENAIVHGILEKQEQIGNVLIEAWKNDDCVKVLVRDDAGLLQVEKVKQLLRSPEDGRRGGYGLKNVDERLRLFGGSTDGLKFYLDDEGWSVFEADFMVQ